ncbi:TetR family transcriptional regulator C-terminal domain-containing protein [Streptomyces purpurascens]|uniref:TetR family transcriptional regulator C-terminal domain-containing protein n=1 Tax=Streptomyces purpurascens TaxID=1924 RepID=UPI003C2F8BDE
MRAPSSRPMTSASVAEPSASRSPSQRDEATRVFAVDLYAQLHAWVGDAVRRGIDSGEFTPTDVDDLSTLVLSLSDGYGIRLMLRDPTVTLDTALTSVWRHVSTALGLPDTVPTA